jgi:hypothetical protein
MHPGVVAGEAGTIAPHEAAREPTGGVPAGVADIGVLFVHGVGSQRRGQTVVDWTEPLIEWIEQWLDGPVLRVRDDRRQHKVTGAAAPTDPTSELEALGCRFLGGVEIGASTLRAEGLAPAHCQFSVRLTPLEGESRHARWLVAESWWAESFVQPPFAAFAQWGLGVVPWTVANQFSTRLRRALKVFVARHRDTWSSRLLALLDPVRYLLYLFMGFVGALVLQLLVTLLLVAALIPIGRVRRFLATVQEKLGSTVGDSFVLLSSPIRCAAIVARARADIAWLAARCRTVVVVGHSQGAAIAHMALREQRPPHVRMLVTVGSGLSKLEELQYLRRFGTTNRNQAWLVLVGLLGCFVLLPRLLTDATSDLLQFAAGMAIYIVFVGAVSSLEGLNEDRQDQFRLPGVEDSLRWIDYYASADPVPNGPLFDNPPPWITSKEVHNRGAVFTDHTAYWKNSDGFIASLVQELSALTACPLAAVCAGDDVRLREAQERRRWRVKWLIAARLFIVASAASALWSARAHLAETGAPVTNAVEVATSRLPSLFAGLLTELAALVGLDDPRVVAVGTVAIGVWALYAVVAWLWSVWGHHDLRHLVRRRPVDEGGIGFIAFVASVGLATAVLLTIAVTGTFESLPAAGAAIATAFPRLWLAAVVMFAASVIWEPRRPKLGARIPFLAIAPDASPWISGTRRFVFFASGAALLLLAGAVIDEPDVFVLPAVLIALVGSELYARAGGRVSWWLSDRTVAPRAPVRYDAEFSERNLSLAAITIASATIGFGFAMLTVREIVEPLGLAAVGRMVPFVFLLLGGVGSFFVYRDLSANNRTARVLAIAGLVLSAAGILAAFVWPLLRWAYPLIRTRIG